MKTIKTTTKYGGQALSEKNPVARDGFKIEAEAEVSDDQYDTLARLGLASVLYRAGANAVTKALGVKVPTEAEFSDVAASKVAVALGQFADSGVEGLGAFALDTNVTRHVHGETATVFADEKARVASKGGDAKRLLETAKLVGYAETDASKLTVDNVEFLKAIRRYLRAVTV